MIAIVFNNHAQKWGHIWCKSVQLVGGSSFRNDLLQNPYFKCVSTNELVSHVARFRKCHFSVRKRHLWHALFVESKYLLLKSVHSSMFCSSHFWFMLFGLFWRQSYVNITLYLITFCKARWARQKKKSKENHATKVTKMTKTKRYKYGSFSSLRKIGLHFVFSTLVKKYFINFYSII